MAESFDAKGAKVRKGAQRKPLILFVSLCVEAFPPLSATASSGNPPKNGTLEDMKFGKWLGLVLALGFVCTTAAEAQFSVYGEYTATRLSGLKCLDLNNFCSGNSSNSEGASGSTSSNSHVNVTGGWGGVTYDFKTIGPARLGIDLRAGEGHSNKSATSFGGGDGATTTQNVLAGVKATFHTPFKALRPYAQVSAGWARSNVAEPFGCAPTSNPAVCQPTVPFSGNPIPPRTYDNFIQYQGLIGLDIKIFPILDLRLPELALGNMNMVGGSSTAVATSVGVKSASVGIVLHIPSF
jgi:hypothetical protein